MADGTHIEWTDATWNIITGCSVVSPGCQRCYAMKLAGTRLKHHPSRIGLTQDTKAGPVWTGEVRFNEQWLDQPLKWTKPRRIFVCAHGDLFAEGVPDEWIDRVFAVMALAPQHIFQVLTKRAERMRDYAFERQGFPHRENIAWIANCQISKKSHCGRAIPWPLPNVWLGTSVEDQSRADERIPLLLDTPAAVRFISAEPLLGSVRLHETLGDDWLASGKSGERRGLDWVIVGGESGHNSRPMHPDWARSLRDQCQGTGVAYFHKQNGEFLGVDQLGFLDFGDFDGALRDPATDTLRVGKKAAGRLLDGRAWDEFP